VAGSSQLKTFFNFVCPKSLLLSKGRVKGQTIPALRIGGTPMKRARDPDDKQLIGLLITISIMSKRLAQELMSKRKEAKYGANANL
jgi:hypothetical protein